MWDFATWQPLWQDFVQFLPRLFTGLLILVVFWVMGNIAQQAAQRLTLGRRIDHDFTVLLGRIVKIFMLFFGAVTALGTVGVNVTALVTGLGLTGFAVGFALKDIISNALSGMLVMLYKPFKNGDHISVIALEGTVADVNLRYTVLNAEGKRIFVPNASLITNPITVRLPAEPPP